MLKSKVLNITFLLKSKVLNIIFLLKSKVLSITFWHPGGFEKRVCQKSKTHPLFCFFIVFLHRITLS